MFDLSEKTALVTGGSRGIGRAIAEGLSQQGARVIVNGRNTDACEETVNAIKAAGGIAMAQACDLGDVDGLQQMVKAISDKWGGIDILICNAAVNSHFGPIVDLNDSQFDEAMQTNVRNNLRLCSLVLPGMAKRKDGAVVIVSSVNALQGTLNLGTYSISKAAEIALGRNLAAQWGKHNIRVNCVAPGLVKTKFSRALWQNEEFAGSIVKRTPLGRLAEPDDIAGVAVFLASPAAGFVTGQTIVVDGGSTISFGM